MSAGQLRVDHEAVAAVARELAEFRVALDAVAQYAAADDLGPGMFGVLGEQVSAGSAFAQARDALRASFERALPSFDEVGATVEESAKAVTAADEESAAVITRAGGALA